MHSSSEREEKLGNSWVSRIDSQKLADLMKEDVNLKWRGIIESLGPLVQRLTRNQEVADCVSVEALSCQLKSQLEQRGLLEDVDVDDMALIWEELKARLRGLQGLPESGGYMIGFFDKDINDFINVLHDFRSVLDLGSEHEKLLDYLKETIGVRLKKGINYGDHRDVKSILEAISPVGQEFLTYLTTSAGWDPVHWVASKGCDEMSCAIAEVGVSLDVVFSTHRGNETFLTYAARNTNKKLIQYLLKNSVTDQVITESGSAFNIAVRYYANEACAQLLWDAASRQEDRCMIQRYKDELLAIVNSLVEDIQNQRLDQKLQDESLFNEDAWGGLETLSDYLSSLCLALRYLIQFDNLLECSDQLSDNLMTYFSELLKPYVETYGISGCDILSPELDATNLLRILEALSVVLHLKRADIIIRDEAPSSSHVRNMGNLIQRFVTDIKGETAEEKICHKNTVCGGPYFTLIPYSERGRVLGSHPSGLCIGIHALLPTLYNSRDKIQFFKAVLRYSHDCLPLEALQFLKHEFLLQSELSDSDRESMQEIFRDLEEAARARIYHPDVYTDFLRVAQHNAYHSLVTSIRELQKEWRYGLLLKLMLVQRDINNTENTSDRHFTKISELSSRPRRIVIEFMYGVASGGAVEEQQKGASMSDRIDEQGVYFLETKHIELHQHVDCRQRRESQCRPHYMEPTISSSNKTRGKHVITSPREPWRP